MLAPAEEVTLFLRQPLERRPRRSTSTCPTVDPHPAPAPGHLRHRLGERLGCGGRRPDTTCCSVRHTRRRSAIGAGSWSRRTASTRFNPLRIRGGTSYTYALAQPAQRASRRRGHRAVRRRRRTTIKRYGGFPTSGSSSCSQGADDGFRPIDDAEALRAVRRRFFGGDRPYVLFVGKCVDAAEHPAAAAARSRSSSVTRRSRTACCCSGRTRTNLPLAELCAELGIDDDVVQTDGEGGRPHRARGDLQCGGRLRAPVRVRGVVDDDGGGDGVRDGGDRRRPRRPRRGGAWARAHAATSRRSSPSRTRWSGAERRRTAAGPGAPRVRARLRAALAARRRSGRWTSSARSRDANHSREIDDAGDVRLPCVHEHEPLHVPAAGRSSAGECLPHAGPGRDGPAARVSARRVGLPRIAASSEVPDSCRRTSSRTTSTSRRRARRCTRTSRISRGS